jgi:hypothetical protein
MRYGIFSLIFFAFLAQAPAVRAQVPDGRQVMSLACTGCHNLRVIATSGRSRASWAATVGDMIQRGAPVFPNEIQPLIDYLAKTSGPVAHQTSNAAASEPSDKGPKGSH